MKKDSNWNVIIATLSRSRDLGTYLSLDRRPLWALAADAAGETLTELTGHLFCCNISEWTAKVRWGPEDEDGYTSRCLCSKLRDLGQWVYLGFGTWRQSGHVADVPVTREWVLEHYPDISDIFTDDSDDSMRGKPEDTEGE